jgi:Flp pilus assembly protein TadD
MRRIGPLLMSTVLVTGCAGLATNNDSLRTILERSGQSQPRLSAYDQGKRHLQFGKAGLAIQAFEEALKANPDSVPVLNGLAVAYDRLGRGDVSQRYLDRALTLTRIRPSR